LGHYAINRRDQLNPLGRVLIKLLLAAVNALPQQGALALAARGYQAQLFLLGGYLALQLQAVAL
jgi:hypothetical protein